MKERKSPINEPFLLNMKGKHSMHHYLTTPSSCFIFAQIYPTQESTPPEPGGETFTTISGNHDNLTTMTT